MLIQNIHGDSNVINFSPSSVFDLNRECRSCFKDKVFLLKTLFPDGKCSCKTLPVVKCSCKDASSCYRKLEGLPWPGELDACGATSSLRLIPAGKPHVIIVFVFFQLQQLFMIGLGGGLGGLMLSARIINVEPLRGSSVAQDW